MKRVLAMLISIILVVAVTPITYAATVEIDAPYAILIEADSKKVLFEKEADIQRPPASVTKVMTILLIVEAIDSGRISLDDEVQVSENAASMGGSQVFLEPYEVMSVQDMLKAIVVASGNDACVAMAEFISGSEESFVALMNERAEELGMVNTSFMNPHGLDEAGHYTTARDIALMSAELLRHDWILEYTTIWMDSIRGGEFELANTNKLLRSYNGITGLKTGSTGEALYCISASATRDGLDLIAVILAGESSDERFLSAAKLLDFGFANFTSQKLSAGAISPVRIIGGKEDYITPIADPAEISIVLAKGEDASIEVKTEMPIDLLAPIEKGQIIGNVVYMSGGEEIGRANLIAENEVLEKSFLEQINDVIKKIILG